MHVLATTRIEGWESAVARVDIGSLNLKDAVSFMRNESGRRDGEDADWEALAKAVGTLPVALSHIAIYLRRAKVVTPARCLQRVRALMAASPSLKDAEASVDATYRLAIERVDTETPGASLLMNFLSFFEASAIPLEVLEQPPEIYPEVLRSTLSDPIVRDEAVSAVVDVSLADGRMQDYLQKKRTLAFDFVRRGDRAGAAAVQLELCREIRGSVGLNGVTSADLERELRNYGGMATDAGEKSWVIKANFREIGYRCQPAFKVGDLMDGITIVESVSDYRETRSCAPWPSCLRLRRPILPHFWIASRKR